MNLPAFIAKRISFQSKRKFSKLSVRIAVIGIMLSLSVMMLAIAIVKGFQTEIREKMRGFSGDILLIPFDLSSTESTPFSLNSDTLKKLKAYPEIEYMHPYAIKPGIINVNNEVEGVVMKGVDKTFNWNFFKKILVAGDVIDFSDSLKAKSQILISQHIANRLRLKVGDTFIMYFLQQTPRPRRFKIAGIYNLGVEDVDKAYVIGDLSVIKRINDWKDTEVGGYELRVNDFNRLDEINAKVSDNINYRLRSYPVTLWHEIIFQWLALLDINTVVILILMLAVAVINMISALLIIILERTNMIGILKALGSTNWNIQKIFLLNAAYLIGLGLLFGNLLGIGLGLLQNYTHFLKLDQTSYYMSFVPVQLELWDIVLLNIGTITLCLLVLIIPSMLVTRISPVKAIAFK
ncbi:MAG: ABC transporter permease [Pyrinomonadaceae bacterium]|nr:ABC transporter permease [Sphingobacteriaceae bacterium]